MSSEIFHYGVLGMKWGVRRERGPDGRVSSDAQFIRKGARIQNISGDGPRELRDKTPLYASYTEMDNALYAGWYAYTKKYWEDVEPYKNDLVVKQDIKVASQKQAAEKFIEMYKEDPAGMAKSIASTITDRSVIANIRKVVFGTDVVKLDEKRLIRKGEKFMTSEKGQKLFNQTLVSDLHAETRTKYFEALLKDGYGALQDVNDKTNSYKAQTPLIFLDPKSQLKNVAASKLTEQDIEAAINKYELLSKKKS